MAVFEQWYRKALVPEECCVYLESRMAIVKFLKSLIRKQADATNFRIADDDKDIGEWLIQTYPPQRGNGKSEIFVRYIPSQRQAELINLQDASAQLSGIPVVMQYNNGQRVEVVNGNLTINAGAAATGFTSL